MDASLKNRKGPRKVEDLSPEVLELLNSGVLETVNLTEWLAIDQAQLVKNTFPALGLAQATVDSIAEEITAQKKPTAMNSTKVVGSALHNLYPTQEAYQDIFEKLSAHAADALRCYAPYLIAQDSRLTVEQKLDRVKKLVADHHFGVREVVWMALRPSLEESLEPSIRFLSTWTADANENVRRFTTEATRPRGVWCKHIHALVDEPEFALPLLEPLKSDPAKYVQDSVGNWLNDASKSRPDFVTQLCEKWEQESPTAETKKIIKKARRTIDKK
ncbi:MAG: DNA alkylation repair protein [Bacteroidota bacterium]